MGEHICGKGINGPGGSASGPLPNMGASGLDFPITENEGLARCNLGILQRGPTPLKAFCGAIPEGRRLGHWTKNQELLNYRPNIAALSDSGLFPCVGRQNSQKVGRFRPKPDVGQCWLTSTKIWRSRLARVRKTLGLKPLRG